MTRWHDAACTEPQVVLADNWPTCTACGHSCPPLEIIKAGQPSSASAVPELPPDEPPGELNLWWPLSVPYVNPDGSRPRRPAARKRNGSSSGCTEPSPIYDKTLTDEEFRLVCLSAVEGSDSPLHVTLETYSDDCHPEYEAASYLWGGEDGDYSLQKPVFIGPYWDVALLTKNCWSMLRFARPWRGVRMLFVDAVSINQQDLEERGIQVAKMGQIYVNCTRVVVYLGDDIATTTTRFCSSRPLYDLESETVDNSFPKGHSLAREQFGLGQLLQRKYFSRVWMIQELVLSERAIFRLGNVDYRADANIMARIMSTIGKQIREDSTTQWIEWLGKGNDALGGTVQLLSLMQLTRHLHASDPRDLLYGVLPLACPCAQSLVPDYSVSSQHFLFGICAYLLLNDKQPSVLTLPKGARKNISISEPQLPSWLPDFVTSGLWQDILRNVENSPAAGGTLSYEPHMRSVWSIDFRERIAKDIAQRASASVIYHHHSGGQYHPLWYDGARICSTSGALSIKLIHLFALSHPPKFRWTYEAPQEDLGSRSSSKPQNIYSLHGEGNWRNEFRYLFLVSQARLSELILPDKDHLFALFPEEDGEYIYLILRRHVGSSDNAEYTLVTSDLHIFEAQSTSAFFGPTSRSGGVLLLSVAQMIAGMQFSDEIKTFVRLEACGTRVWSRLREMLPNPLTTDWFTAGAPVDAEPCYFRFKANGNPDGECDVYIELSHDGESPEGGIQSWKLEGDEQDALFQILSLCWKPGHRNGNYGPEWFGRLEGASEWREATWQASLNDGVWSVSTMLHCVRLCQRQGSSWTRQNLRYTSGLPQSLTEELDRRVHQDILLKPLPTVMRHILNEIDGRMGLMRNVRDAYEPSLTMEALLDMIRVGPTEEQKYIKERKTIGLFELDGRALDVKIV